MKSNYVGYSFAMKDAYKLWKLLHKQVYNSCPMSDIITKGQSWH